MNQIKIKAIHERRHEYARMAFNTHCELSPPVKRLEISYQRAMCFLHRIEIFTSNLSKNGTFNQLPEF